MDVARHRRKVLLATLLALQLADVTALTLKARDGASQQPMGPAPAPAAMQPVIPAVAAAARAPPGMQPDAAKAAPESTATTTTVPLAPALAPIDGPQFEPRETRVEGQSLAGKLIDSAASIVNAAGLKALEPPGDVEVDSINEDFSHVVAPETVRRIISIRCLEDHYEDKDKECNTTDYMQTPPAIALSTTLEPLARVAPAVEPEPWQAAPAPMSPAAAPPMSPSAAPPASPASAPPGMTYAVPVAKPSVPEVTVESAANAIDQAIASSIAPNLVAQAAASALEISPLEVDTLPSRP
eukprot:TRINITY_DN80028_c0_g1_i1.p1 TRINITY_DN80028_c0_g1~~TRINITY_DN80028_c0_g1_i1.p1  ORF type:complete len:297 (+),score=79.92 TRINITY_DN80028_c0_g1_i1:95-985(+)